MPISKMSYAEAILQKLPYWRSQMRLLVNRAGSPFICRASSISGDVVFQALDSKYARVRRMARPGRAASGPCRGLALAARRYRIVARRVPSCPRLFHAFLLTRTALLDSGGTGFLQVLAARLLRKDPRLGPISFARARSPILETRCNTHCADHFQMHALISRELFGDIHS